jgi:hypothetical protein
MGLRLCFPLSMGAIAEAAKLFAWPLLRIRIAVMPVFEAATETAYGSVPSQVTGELAP